MCASGRAEARERNGFDKLAGAYRWMEYLSFGPLLWRTRVAWLQQMLGARHALVLGDGDGRFTAALLRANAAVQVTAVDASEGMLAAMQRRVSQQGDGSRLTVVHQDARAYLPVQMQDLICTHFFLDCLRDTETRQLMCVCAEALRQDGVWIVSEFAIPHGLARPAARLLVRSLYLCFRMLTGLRVNRLPDYAAAMREAGLTCVAVQTNLFGLLRAEVWKHTHACATDAVEAASNRA